MMRVIGLSLMWLPLAFCMAHGAPARPLHVPPEPPKTTPVFDVRGTAWEGSFFAPSGRSVWFAFNPDGTISYRGIPHGDMATGRWTLSGNKIVFDVNNYSHHTGTLQGDVIEGESTNVGGMRGPFRIQRVGLIEQSMPREKK